MNKNLFLKIVLNLADSDLGNFTYTHEGKIYAFREVGEGTWEDDGKYQYKTEEGQLIEIESNYKEIQRFNYGVSRSISRTGSYYSDYYYNYEPYKPFEIKELLIPEIIIPAHTELKWNKLNTPQSIIDEFNREEEEKIRIEQLEQQRIEEEKKALEELKKKYTMNDYKVIQEVNKNLKKTGESITIKKMQEEYFRIVEKKGLKDADWLDYHRENTLKD